MADPNIQERLREGVEAARRGDKLTARRLLQQVLLQDRNNEAALMWMASVMDSVAERRAYLERVVQINPNNDRAREALNRLGGPSRTGGVTAAPSTTSLRGRGTNTYLIAAAVVAVLLVAVVVMSLLSAPRPPDPIEATFAAAIIATSTPSPIPTLPTPTFFGIVVTPDASLVNLPPTFTPTLTPEPSQTPEPTATPIPVEAFPVFYSEFEPNGTQPSLFGVFDDGGETALSQAGFYDVAFNPDGEQIVFVRFTEGTPSDAAASEEPNPNGIPQLFVASVDNPEDARQITEMGGTNMVHPSWSSDGESIVFSSNEDGDEELYMVSSSGGNPQRLTDNTAIDTSPAFSPDGNHIAFTSDADSPGFTEIYIYSLEDGGIGRITDDSGNNYAPAWSPDGSRIAYISDKSGDGDIYVMDADGSRAFQITPDDQGAEDRSPTWSPDGNWVAFVSNRGSENFQLFAVNVETREVVPLTNDDLRNAQSIVFRPR